MREFQKQRSGREEIKSNMKKQKKRSFHLLYNFCLQTLLSLSLSLRKENEKLMQVFQEHADEGMRWYNEANYINALQCKQKKKRKEEEEEERKKWKKALSQESFSFKVSYVRTR